MTFPSHEVTKLTGHSGTPCDHPSSQCRNSRGTRSHSLSYIQLRDWVLCVFSQFLLVPFWLSISSQQILTGSSDRSIHLFNPLKASASASKDGLVQTYSAHAYEVLDIAVTDDNARFASVGGDKQVFLWDVATARTLRRWSGHFGRVNCVSIGGEGASVVISGSFDATVRLWDCRSQNTKPIQVFEEARDSVSSVHVVEHEIITGCVDGRLRVYDLRMGMMFVDVIGRTVLPCLYSWIWNLLIARRANHIGSANW